MKSSLETTDREIETFFQVGMYWRIVYGCFRFVLGCALLRFIGTPIPVALTALSRHGSDGFFIRLLDPFFHHFQFPITYFIAAYLIFWGAVDVVLSISLLKHKLWAFPVSLVLIFVFVLYEIFRYTHTHSGILLGIIVVDIFLIWIIRSEYLKLSRKIKRKASDQ